MATRTDHGQQNDVEIPFIKIWDFFVASHDQIICEIWKLTKLMNIWLLALAHKSSNTIFTKLQQKYERGNGIRILLFAI